MAILHNINKEILTGKAGNIVFKNYNGKNVMCQKPSSYRMSHSRTAVEGRNKFKVTAHLSTAVSALPDLKSIWKTVKDPGCTIHQTICKYNYAKSSASKPTADNIITPGGAKLPVTAASVEADKISASVSAMNALPIYTEKAANLSFNAVVCFIDPVNENTADYEFISCTKEIAGFDFNQAYELQIDFYMKQKLIASKYSRYILYLCAASKSIDGELVKFSATYSSLGAHR